MCIITKKEIEKRLKSIDIKNRLVVTPIISKKQIANTSIDVRLGNQFVIFKTHTLGDFNPYKTQSAKLRKMQERKIVRFGDEFVLHPGMLVLGSTFEYLRIPYDLECHVEGRSSWARIGLQIATATSVEPGFKGVLTLELSNLGTIPIELCPGVRIAQLLFNKLTTPISEPYGKERKYKCPIGPEFSKIHEDKDGAVFAQEYE